MAFHAFRVGFCDFPMQANSRQQFDRWPMLDAHTTGKGMAGFGEEDAAIRAGGIQYISHEASNRLERRGLRDTERFGHLGSTRLTKRCQKIIDQLGIVFL